MNINWCIHANFCLKPNLTTKLTQNTDAIQTNSLVAETTSCGRGLTDWLTPLLFQLPIWRMMATPSFNVPSYKTSHDWLWDPSQPASPCIFCSIVDLTSLYLLPYFTIIRPQLLCSLEVFLNIIQQNNTSYWCIYLCTKQWRKHSKNKILSTQLNIVTFFCDCRRRTMLTF